MISADDHSTTCWTTGPGIVSDTSTNSWKVTIRFRRNETLTTNDVFVVIRECVPEQDVKLTEFTQPRLETRENEPKALPGDECGIVAQLGAEVPLTEAQKARPPPRRNSVLTRTAEQRKGDGERERRQIHYRLLHRRIGGPCDNDGVPGVAVR